VRSHCAGASLSGVGTGPIRPAPNLWLAGRMAGWTI
jgi:hypothetical protein